MIKLTDRLACLAGEITKGQTMADIGTDHGLLPLYLWERGICPRVIMCDISAPSLQKARDAAARLIAEICMDYSNVSPAHCSESLPSESAGLRKDTDFAYRRGASQPAGGSYAEECLQFRLGSGVEVLEPGEVDAVVIAGMGGSLISEILESNIKKSVSFSKFILQPRNNSGKLRHYLTGRGFEITSNHLVREGKFICEVITAESPGEVIFTEPCCPEESAVWDLPENLRGESLYSEFAAGKLSIEEKILRGMSGGNSVTKDEIDARIKRAEYFREAAGSYLGN